MCVAASAAVSAWIRLALLHIIGTSFALESFWTVAFEVATGQRCARTTIVTW